MQTIRPYQYHKIPMAFPIFVSMMCGAVFLMTPLVFKLGLTIKEIFGLSDMLAQTLVYLSPITAISSGVLSWLYWRDDQIKGFIVSSLLLPIYWVSSFYIATEVQL